MEVAVKILDLGISEDIKIFKMTLNYLFPWFTRILSATNISQQFQIGKTECPFPSVCMQPFHLVLLLQFEHTNVNLLYLITLVL